MAEPADPRPVEGLNFDELRRQLADWDKPIE
jgi:hypothetical protein